MADSSTKSLIRSCLVSTKRGCSLEQLARDFEDLVGTPIPFKENGFQTLELFLRSIPDTVRLTGVGGETLVEYVPVESVVRLASLVSRQKGKQKPSKVLKPKKRTVSKKAAAGKLRPSDGVGPALFPRYTSSVTADRVNSETAGADTTARPAKLSSEVTPAADRTQVEHRAPRRRQSDMTDSQSESESDAGLGARAARFGRGQGLADSLASLHLTSTDLSGGGRPARAAPALCPHHRPPRVCHEPACPALHLCRLFLDGFCPRDAAACRWGHAVTSAENRAALQLYRLQGLPEPQLLWLARALLRQTAPVADEEYRRQLALCADYAADADCRRPDCFRVHLCPRLVSGRCRAGDDCRWGHRLTGADNLMVLLLLRCVDLTEDEVLARLARRVVNDGDGARSSSSVSSSSSSQPAEDPSDVESDRRPTAGANRVNRASDQQTGADGASDQQTGANGASDQQTGADDPSDQQTGADGASDQQTGADDASAQQTGADDPSDQQTGAGDPSDQQTGVDDASDQQTATDRVCDQQPAADGGSSPEPSAACGEPTALDVCHDNIHPSECEEETCDKLHVCRFFIAGFCPYWKGCFSHHGLTTTSHNLAVLSRHNLQAACKEDLLQGLRNGYLVRNPITDKERRFALQMCRPYQNGACEKEDCPRLHVCKDYVLGSCKSSAKCRQSHQLNSPSNAAVVRRVGLTSLQAKDILDALRNPLTARELKESWLSGVDR